MSNVIKKNSFHLHSMDGLRGLAILMVFLSHTSNEGTYLLPFVSFAGNGKSGVFLFFVLSSFLLTLPFIRNSCNVNIKNYLIYYFIRRFLRIYPLYFVYLCCALFTTLLLWKFIDLDKPVGVPFSLSYTDFIKQLILIQGRGITWSIQVEFRYYFILPALAITYSHAFKNKLLPSIVLTIALIIIAQIIWPQSESKNNDPRLGPYIPIFFMGSMLAILFHNWQYSSYVENKKFTILLDTLGILSLIIIIFMIPSVSSYFLGKEIRYDYYHRQFILYGLLWCMVIFSCIAGIGRIRKIFESFYLRYLGLISFSFYLLHSVVLAYFKIFNVDFLLNGWLELFLTLGISHITWVLIEVPFSKFRLSY